MYILLLEKHYLVPWRLMPHRAAAPVRAPQHPAPKNWLGMMEEEDVEGQFKPSTSRWLPAQGCVRRGKAGGRGCLATVSVQKDGLTGLRGARESGRWLGRRGLSRQPDLGVNSGSVLHICVNLDKAQNL